MPGTCLSDEFKGLMCRDIRSAVLLVRIDKEYRQVNDREVIVINVRHPMPQAAVRSIVICGRHQRLAL